jgi:hypothetical protein
MWIQSLRVRIPSATHDSGTVPNYPLHTPFGAIKGKLGPAPLFICIYTAMIDQFDDKTAYCRSLGHYVPFRYCRAVNNDLPCRKIMDCWFEKLDIRLFIVSHFTEAQQKQIFSPPPEKIPTILDLIKKAQEQK